MSKLNKHKNNMKKQYRDNLRLPLRMVIYKTVSREELTQYSKRNTNIGQNRYRKHADVDDEVYTFKNVQDNNHYVQTNINFDSAEPLVHDIFNKPIKNKVNLQLENLLSKNHSLKLDEKKKIKEINVYNAVELLKIDKHELYNQTKLEINHVLFDLDEKLSEDNDDFNTLEEKNTGVTPTLQNQQLFNTKHFMNGLNLLGVFNRSYLPATNNINL